MSINLSRRQLAFAAVLLAATAMPGVVSWAEAQTLPAGWTVTEVGQSPAPGAATFGTGAIGVTSRGADVGGKADQFTFVYRSIRGDATVIARLAMLDNVDPWAQAGVMIRESLKVDSTHGFVLGSAANGVAFRSRKSVRSGTSQKSGGAGTAPVWLKIERRSSTLTTWRSADGINWTTISSVKIPMAQTVLAGLAVASHTSAANVVASLSNVRVIGNGTLDGGYSASDIGSSALSGGSWAGGGTFLLDGAGTGIAGTADQFRYVYKQVSGNQDVVARVAGFDTSPSSSRAGLMVRQDLTTGAAQGSLLVSPASGLVLASRSAAGAYTTNVTGGAGTAPTWLKLSRRGTTITALRSTDGVAWTTVGTQTVTLTEPFYVGLAVTSATTQERARATFDGVTITAATATAAPAPTAPNVAPTVSLTAPMDGTVYLAPASVAIAATAADSDGTVARVDFYVGTTLVGSDASSPYAFTWATSTTGSYVLKAVATDDRGASTASATRAITVRVNAAPNVSMTTPADDATFAAPASIYLMATASDTDGTVTQVEFYVAGTLIATDTTSPYAVNWPNVSAGAYSLTAVARDNEGGMTVSSARDITVGEPPSTAVFKPASNHDVVGRYVLEIFQAGSNPAGTAPVATLDLGRPPVVNGECIADVHLIIASLVPGNYIATVSAISSEDGTLRSDPSLVFTR